MGFNNLKVHFLPVASPPVAERTWCTVCAFAEKDSKKARNTKNRFIFMVLIINVWAKLIIFKKKSSHFFSYIQVRQIYFFRYLFWVVNSIKAKHHSSTPNPAKRGSRISQWRPQESTPKSVCFSFFVFPEVLPELSIRDTPWLA